MLTASISPQKPGFSRETGFRSRQDYGGRRSCRICCHSVACRQILSPSAAMMRFAFILTVSAIGPALCAAQPIRPTKTTPLFNGKDLSGLTTWLKDTKQADPRKVFTVSDGLLH